MCLDSLHIQPFVIIIVVHDHDLMLSCMFSVVPAVDMQSRPVNIHTQLLVFVLVPTNLPITLIALKFSHNC